MHCMKLHTTSASSTARDCLCKYHAHPKTNCGKEANRTFMLKAIRAYNNAFSYSTLSWVEGHSLHKPLRSAARLVSTRCHLVTAGTSGHLSTMLDRQRQRGRHHERRSERREQRKRSVSTRQQDTGADRGATGRRWDGGTGRRTRCETPPRPSHLCSAAPTPPWRCPPQPAVRRHAGT